MGTSLNQLMKIALLLAAIDAALVLFPVTAHAGSILVNIDKTNQQMTVSLNGVETYRWRYQLAEQAIQLHREPILPPL